MFWNVVPCGLTNGHHHSEEPAAHIFGAEVKFFEKELCGHWTERSINCHIQSHLTFAFPSLSFQFMLLYTPPLPSVSFILIYLFIVIFHFTLHPSPSSLTYECHLPSNSCHMMAANVPHCLFFLCLFFSFVLFTYFILYVFACIMLFHLLLHFYLWHPPQNNPF